ncbi:MAG: hypothetical protein II491_06380, partial [Prevotella sp.]|nr:hypothetical protein [Prevotella sp.]
SAKQRKMAEKSFFFALPSVSIFSKDTIKRVQSKERWLKSLSFLLCRVLVSSLKIRLSERNKACRSQTVNQYDSYYSPI